MIPTNITPLDIEILARTIYGEARGEYRNGKVAVAWVILNRTSAPRWKSDIMSVCLQPKQFSCWLPKDPNFQKLKSIQMDDVHYRECYGVAIAVCTGVDADNTSGSKHYHASKIKPNWARGKTPVCRIGNHSFYNDIA